MVTTTYAMNRDTLGDIIRENCGWRKCGNVVMGDWEGVRDFKEELVDCEGALRFTCFHLQTTKYVSTVIAPPAPIPHSDHADNG